MKSRMSTLKVVLGVALGFALLAVVLARVGSTLQGPDRPVRPVPLPRSVVRQIGMLARSIEFFYESEDRSLPPPDRLGALLRFLREESRSFSTAIPDGSSETVAFFLLLPDNVSPENPTVVAYTTPHGRAADELYSSVFFLVGGRVMAFELRAPFVQSLFGQDAFTARKPDLFTVLR